MSSISGVNPSSPVRMKSSELVRDKIIFEARKWKGVRFRHQGRSRSGIDCLGLVVLVALELGFLTKMPPADYPRTADGYDFLAAFRQYATEKPTYKRERGDMLIFSERAYPCHVGFWTGHDENTLIHAYAPRKKVVEERYHTGGWTQNTVSCFSFEGI